MILHSFQRLNYFREKEKQIVRRSFLDDMISSYLFLLVAMCRINKLTESNRF